MALRRKNWPLSYGIEAARPNISNLLLGVHAINDEFDITPRVFAVDLLKLRVELIFLVITSSVV